MKQKYKQIKVNLKPEDFAKLDEICSIENITKAEYIRKNLNLSSLEKVRTPRQNLNDPAENLNRFLLYEISKIGNNLNQIAHYANTHKTLDTEILRSLVNIEKKLNDLI